MSNWEILHEFDSPVMSPDDLFSFANVGEVWLRFSQLILLIVLTTVDSFLRYFQSQLHHCRSQLLLQLCRQPHQDPFTGSTVRYLEFSRDHFQFRIIAWPSTYIRLVSLWTTTETSSIILLIYSARYSYCSGKKRSQTLIRCKWLPYPEIILLHLKFIEFPFIVTEFLPSSRESDLS